MVLFLATLLTTLMAGAMQEGVNPLRDVSLLYRGIPFSLTLILILGSHELGHYLMARRHGVRVTLPLFIPVPPPHPLGTFGAFIRIRSPIPDRRALLDIAVAGPLAGFAVAVPAIAIGLTRSPVGLSPSAPEGITLGSSLLFSLMVRVVLGQVPADTAVLLHPVAFAGWIGLLVTALNLLPLGQLDGGHLLYALFHRGYHLIGRVAFGFLIPLGFYWQGWFLWAAFIAFFGLRHPPLLDEWTPLDNTRRLSGAVALLVFVLSFVPVPFRF